MLVKLSWFGSSSSQTPGARAGWLGSINFVDQRSGSDLALWSDWIGAKAQIQLCAFHELSLGSDVFSFTFIISWFIFAWLMLFYIIYTIFFDKTKTLRDKMLLTLIKIWHLLSGACPKGLDLTGAYSPSSSSNFYLEPKAPAPAPKYQIETKSSNSGSKISAWSLKLQLRLKKSLAIGDC